MNIYISNLDSTISNEDLKNLFSAHGEVQSAEIVTDVFTGESRGFGFVEMNDDAKAQQAIETLNNTKLSNLTVSVQMAPQKVVQKGSYRVGSGPIKEYRFKKN